MTSSSYRIVDYDPHWPQQFQQEKSSILHALGFHADHVEHIGSTAVPGLGAKPIIDIMVGVHSSTKSDGMRQFIELLQRIGYEHRGETVPGTLYIRKAEPQRYNLHMTEHRGEFWLVHLLFRDYLRAHKDQAYRYEELKRQLIARLAPEPDRAAYNDGKTAFISSVLEAARTEGKKRLGKAD